MGNLTEMETGSLEGEPAAGTSIVAGHRVWEEAVSPPHRSDYLTSLKNSVIW
jgi:hypothetical protein